MHTYTVLFRSFVSMLVLSACSSLQPISPPSSLPVPKSSSDVMVHAQGEHIRSPIQAFEMDKNQNGVLLWREDNDNLSPHFQGVLLRKGVFADQVSFFAEGLFQMRSLLHLSSEGRGFLVWNKRRFDMIGPDNPKPLAMVSIQNNKTTNIETHLGFYALHSSAIDTQGNGYLLVSNERAQYASPIDKPQQSDYTHVYLIPVKNWSIQLSNINDEDVSPVETQQKAQETRLQVAFEIPVHLRGANIVLAGIIESTGEGMVIWRDPNQMKVFSTRLSQFKALGPAQEIALPYALSTAQLSLKLDRGQGYLAWPDREGLQFLKIQSYTAQKTSEKMKLPIDKSCSFRDQPEVQAWDMDIDANGDGVISWLNSTRTQIILQKVNTFKLDKRQHKVTSPDAMGVCMAKIQLTTPRSVMLAALSTTCVDQNCTSTEKGIQKMIWTKQELF